jgi:hypothetical protein
MAAKYLCFLLSLLVNIVALFSPPIPITGIFRKYGALFIYLHIMTPLLTQPITGMINGNFPGE